MARTARAATVITSVGPAVNLTGVDSANGETMPYNGRRVLHVKNSSGGSINVTVKNPTLIDGQAAPDRVVAVAAGAEKRIGLQSAVYQQADGNNYVDYSASASVTAELIEV